MKLKEFLKNLNEMAIDDPSILNLEVIFSVDEEGNRFEPICFEPTLGFYDEDDKDFFLMIQK